MRVEERYEYHAWNVAELVHPTDFPFLVPFWGISDRSKCVRSESNSSFFKPLLAMRSASSTDTGHLPGSYKRLWLAHSEDISSNINTQPYLCTKWTLSSLPSFRLASQVVQSIFLKTRDKMFYIMNQKSVYFLRCLHRFTVKQFYAPNDISSGTAHRKYNLCFKALKVVVFLLWVYEIYVGCHGVPLDFVGTSRGKCIRLEWITDTSVSG